MKSRQSKVASLCKQYLKSLGIKANVKSKSFSGGDSVDVQVFDILPKQMKKIEEELSKYQYGHFNGMIDLYEYSNTRDDIPQTKFLHITNNMTSETESKIKEFLKEKWDIIDDTTSQAKMQCWYNCAIWRIFNGSYDETCSSDEIKFYKN